MPEEFAISLIQFADKVSKEIQKEKISAETGSPIRTSLNKLAEATTKLKEEGIYEEKKKTIRDRLKDVAVSLVRMSPTIARVVIGLTPLAPYSNLAGETFESMVQAALPQ